MKKTFSLVYFCVAMLLVLVMTIGAFMPMMKVNNLTNPYHESYATGHFTKGTLAPAETNFGLGTIIKNISNFGDIATVIDIQNREQAIREQHKLIAKIEEKLRNADLSEYSKEHYEEDLEEATEDLLRMTKKLEERLDKISEDDEARIAAKLETETFRQGLGMFYSLYSLITNNINEDTFSSKAGTSGIIVGVLKFIFLMFFLVLLVVMVIVPIIMAVKLLKAIIYFIKNIKNESGWSGDKLTDKLPTIMYLVVLLMAYLFLSLVFFGVFSIGAGAYVFIIALAIIYALRNASAIINAPTKEALIHTSIKQGLALVSLVLAIIFLSNFTSIGLTGELIDNMDNFRDAYIDERVDELVDDGKEIAKAENMAKMEADNKLMSTVGIFFCFSFVALIIAMVAFISSFERFGLRKQKLKDGRVVPYSAMIVSAVLLIAIAIVPNFFGVEDLDDRKDAYEDGKFKIVYDEYLIDGSPAQLEYNAAKAALELANGGIEIAQKAYDAASGEIKESLKVELETAKDYAKQLEIAVDDLKTDQKGNIITCIIIAILFLAVEIAYKATPKTEYHGKVYEVAAAPAAEETPAPSAATAAPAVTETPAAPAPVEEAPAPAEEAPAPAEEAPAPVEEAPAPAEEAPAPAEEAPVEEAPAEDAPATEE